MLNTNCTNSSIAYCMLYSNIWYILNNYFVFILLFYFKRMYIDGEKIISECNEDMGINIPVSSIKSILKQKHPDSNNVLNITININLVTTSAADVILPIDLPIKATAINSTRVSKPVKTRVGNGIKQKPLLSSEERAAKAAYLEDQRFKARVWAWRELKMQFADVNDKTMKYFQKH